MKAAIMAQEERLLSIGAVVLSCLALVVALVVALGQNLTPSTPTAPPPADIDTVKSKLDALDTDLEALKSETNVKFADIQYEYAAAKFSSTDPNFRLLKTDYGLLMIALRGTEKSGDGYKLIFDIGNPSSITLSGLKGTITWRPAIGTYEEVQKKRRSKDFEVLSDIYPGAWNRVAISIGPATEETIGTIIMGGLSVNAVKMRTINIGN